MKPEPIFLTISEVSRLSGYSVHHLRQLCRDGIVRPERTAGGVRLFTHEDVGRLQARREQTVKQ